MPCASGPAVWKEVLDMVNIGNDWDGLLAGEFEKEYYKKLRAFSMI